jgi:hypothetical protein
MDIERWLLKTLHVLYHTSITSVGPKTHALPPDFLSWYDDPLPPPFGLYLPFRGPKGEQVQFRLASHASIQLLTVDSVVAGIAVSLGGFVLRLVICGRDGEVGSLGGEHVYRPKFVNFFQGAEVVSLGFAWREGYGSGLPMWISRGDPNAAPPTSK